MSLGWLESCLQERGVRKSYLKRGLLAKNFPERTGRKLGSLVAYLWMTVPWSLGSLEYLIGRHTLRPSSQVSFCS